MLSVAIEPRTPLSKQYPQIQIPKRELHEARARHSLAITLAATRREMTALVSAANSWPLKHNYVELPSMAAHKHDPRGQLI